MTGIAEAGRGEYCFLKNAQVIPGLVSKSVHGLLSLVGTDARIVFRGLNGAVVTKIYGHDEDAAAGGGGGGENPMLDGVPLGDLHASNVRQILVELELAPASGSMDGEEAKGDEDGDGGGGGGGAAAMLLGGGKPVLEYTLEYAAAVSKEEERNELLSALLNAAEVVESGQEGGKAGGAAVKDTAAMEAAVVKAMQDLTAAISSGHLRGFEKAAVVGTVKEARGKLDAAGCHWSAALAKTFQVLVKTVNDPTRDPSSGQGQAAGDGGSAAPGAPKLVKQKSSSGRPMLTINGTMRLEGTDDRDTMRVPGHPAVEAAYALQVAAQGDEEVIARLDAGDLAAAMFAKGKVVEVLNDALRRMDGVGGDGEGEGGGGGGNAGGDGGNAEGKDGGAGGNVVVGGGGSKGGVSVDRNRRMVETALIKARKLLENMQNDRDIRSSRLENFEGCRLNRAMSARALSDRADSDDGRAYSDAGSDEDNRFDDFRYDDDGNETDDESDFGSDGGGGGCGGGGGGGGDMARDVILGPEVPRSLGLRRALT